MCVGVGVRKIPAKCEILVVGIYRDVLRGTLAMFDRCTRFHFELVCERSGSWTCLRTILVWHSPVGNWRAKPKLRARVPSIGKIFLQSLRFALSLPALSKVVDSPGRTMAAEFSEDPLRRTGWFWRSKFRLASFSLYGG